MDRNSTPLDHKKCLEKWGAVQVEVTKSCISFRREPEVRKHRVNFLFDIRDRKVRRLYSGSSDEGIGFEVLDCVDEERYWK